MLKNVPKKWLFRILITIISALLFAISSTAISIYSYGSNSYNNKADAAIVLGAAVWGEEPSPVFRERINHAINPDALFKECVNPADNRTPQRVEPVEYLKVPGLDSGVKVNVTKF